jgi:PIN domain nuclease of toxin-antitoxin system
MKLLLDTQMLLWAMFWPELLPEKASQLIGDTGNTLYFSPASLWEVSIKNAQNKPAFQVDARMLRTRLLDCGYEELIINGLHTVATGDLPGLHRDPFDRLLLAQSQVDCITLLTCDARIAEYPAPVLFIPR